MKRSEFAPAMQRDGVSQKELAEELTKRTGVPVSAPKISRWLSGAVEAMRGIKTADVAAAFEAVLADRRARHEAWEQEVAAGALMPKRTAEEVGQLLMHRRTLPVALLCQSELEERIERRERWITSVLRDIANNDHVESPEDTGRYLAEIRGELADARAELKRRCAGNGGYSVPDCECGRSMADDEENFCPRCGRSIRALVEAAQAVQ